MHHVSLQPEMPPLEAGGYLLGYLFEVGPVMAGGGGVGPLTYQELGAWQAATGIELRAWEARFLRRLSGEYLAESRRAEQPDCPPPWQAADRTDERLAVAKRLQADILRRAQS